MSEDKQVTLAEFSLKQLLGILSVGQLRAVIGIVFVLVGGSFGFGMLVNEVRTTHSYQSKDKLAKLNNRYMLQIEFLERSNAYLNARIKGKEDALNGDWVEDVKNRS